MTKQSTILLIALAISAANGFCQQTENIVRLENNYCAVDLDASNGAILRIADKPGQLELVTNPQAAQSFRLEIEDNSARQKLIWGFAQKASAVESRQDAAIFRWDRPLTDANGTKQAIKVQLDVKLKQEAIVFKMTLENGTQYRIAGVFYPAIGGLQDFGGWSKEEPTRLMTPRMGETEPNVIKIDSGFKDIALFYPQQVTMSFADIYNAKCGRGMYISSQEKLARTKQYYFMVLPAGSDREALACVRHTPYTKPGQKFEGSEFVIKFHDGDWRQAGQLYRKWFIDTFGLADREHNWIRTKSFFSYVMMMLPEGNLLYKFSDVPQVAAQAKSCGIDSLHISGWQMGGHDNGYPYYEPDPRVGTYEDLRKAAKECRKIGVKLYLFVNFEVATIGTEWYQRELHKYLEARKDGRPNWKAAWPMGTLYGRMGHGKEMVFLDPTFEGLSTPLVRYFVKLARTGVDGIHIDKVYPTGMNFNPLTPRDVDTSAWEGAAALAQRTLTECRKVNPNFDISIECAWDRILAYTCATWWYGNLGVCRRFFPESAETTQVSEPYDFVRVNNLVREGVIVMVGLHNFTKPAGWEPAQGLMEYIKEVKAIRDQLAETVFFGQMLGLEAVRFAQPFSTGVDARVWQNIGSGKRVCILTNSSMEDRREKLVKFEGQDGRHVRLYRPFSRPVDYSLPAAIKIPAEGIVFVAEVPPNPDVLKLENAYYLVEIDKTNGAIKRIFDKVAWLEMVSEPRLADNFKFTLEIPGKQAWDGIEGNFLLGKDQKLTSAQQDANSLTLVWAGPLKNYLGQPFDASARMKIDLAEQNIRFEFAIENASALNIGEVYYPLIAGMQGLGLTGSQQKATLFARQEKDGVVTTDIFRKFDNFSWLGSQGPEQFYAYPQRATQPWMVFCQNQLNRSAYLGAHDPADRPKVLYLELLPGTSGTVRNDGNWPRPHELKGTPVGVTACFVDFVHAIPNGTYEAAPVIITFCDGDWTAGAEIYRSWLAVKNRPYQPNKI